VTRKLMDKAIDPSLKDFNFNAFYGNESKGVDIVDAAQTLPMFSDRRAVLVKRAELLKARRWRLCCRIFRTLLKPPGLSSMARKSTSEKVFPGTEKT
jgi:hypothetical protein